MNEKIYKTNILSSTLFIGNNAFVELERFLGNKSYKSSQLYVLVDENTKKYCLPTLINNINIFKKAAIIEIISGEDHKTIDNAVYIWERLLKLKADRNVLFINMGGGVICDLGGFAASLYKRGISFINIPTTLMAQIDASFGGKNGIDMGGIKNQIGTFNNPEAVFIYPEFLKTLNKRQKLSGFAEVIKYSIISKSIFFEDIIGIDFENLDNLQKIIYESVGTKGIIVSNDYKENGLRKTLNFGHTIGHAIEAFSVLNNTDVLLHGEAIAVGIICEIYLSVKKFSFPLELQHKYNTFIINKFGKHTINRSSYNYLIELMRNDKKNHNDEINFVLMKDIGKPMINQQCEENEIIESLDYYVNL